MTTLSAINKEIKYAGLISSNKFVLKFVEHEEQIIRSLQQFDGLQSEIYLDGGHDKIDQLKFAAIFSDFISIYTGGDFTDKSHATYFNPDSPYFVDRKITIPPSLISEIRQDYNLRPFYLHNSSSSIKKTIRAYSPLIDNNKAMIRPIRSLWVDKQLINKSRESLIYYAEANTDNRHWVLKDNFSVDSLPISGYMNSPQCKVLFDLTIPYFRDATLKNLTSVLVDENDVISPFRKELKNIVRGFDVLKDNLKEIQQDILRPQIDSINRRFNHIRNIQTINRLGSMAAFSLSLIQILISKDQVADAVSKIIQGLSLSNLILSETEYQRKQNELRDNPYFLLWRIQRIK